MAVHIRAAYGGVPYSKDYTLTAISSVLGVYVWNENGPNGRRKRYRVRGVGALYDAFYLWLRERPTAGDDHEDWPWHYFSFADPSHDADLAAKWAANLFHDDDDDTPYQPPRQPSQLECEMFEALQEAIMAEISREIVASITDQPTSGPSTEELKSSIKQRQERIQALLTDNLNIQSIQNGKKN